MIKIEVDTTLPEMMKLLEQVEPEKWKGILQRTVNETGYYALNKIRKEMSSHIDRPVAFTLNAMYLMKAGGKHTKDEVDASIQWRTFNGKGNSIGGDYLKPIIHGSASRPLKRFERLFQDAGVMPRGFVAVPTKDCELDGHGNISRQQIMKLISYLRAAPADTQQNRPMKARQWVKVKTAHKRGLKVNGLDLASRKKAARARERSRKFFAVIRGRNGATLPSGIYERRNMTMGSAIIRIIAFVPAASYKASFPFYEIAGQAVRAKLPEKLRESIALALDKGR